MKVWSCDIIDAVSVANILLWKNIFCRSSARYYFLITILFCVGHLFINGPVMASDKMIIGNEEEVLVEPYGIKVPARIDTGAATTSLDARNIKVAGNTVTFNIPEKYGGTRISLPIITWKYIHTTRSRDRRPVVEMDLCIASKRIRARVNLNDRSRMNYPMIIGRNILAGHFVVDVSRSRTAVPECCGEEKDQ